MPWEEWNRGKARISARGRVPGVRSQRRAARLSSVAARVVPSALQRARAPLRMGRAGARRKPVVVCHRQSSREVQVQTMVPSGEKLPRWIGEGCSRRMRMRWNGISAGRRREASEPLGAIFLNRASPLRRGGAELNAKHAEETRKGAKVGGFLKGGCLFAMFRVSFACFAFQFLLSRFHDEAVILPFPLAARRGGGPGGR